MKFHKLFLLEAIGAASLLLGTASGRLHGTSNHPQRNLPKDVQQHLQRKLPKGGGGGSNPCSPNPCQNDGTCVPPPETVMEKGFRCDCTPDWVGMTCDVYVCNTTLDALVVGLGWAGITASYELQKYKEYIKEKNNTDFKFVGLEYDDKVGGRAQAAELVSGEGNPITQMVWELFSGNPNSPDYLLYVNQKWSDIAYYNVSGTSAVEIDSQPVNAARQRWNDAFQCLQEIALGGEEERSMREVLKDPAPGGCGWDYSPCTAGIFCPYSDIERYLMARFEWYDLNYEFLATPENSCPAGNLPLATYTEEYVDRDWFVSAAKDASKNIPGNSAKIAERFAHEFIEKRQFGSILRLNEEVTSIDWCKDPVEVHVRAPGSCSTYKAKKVVVTTSAGALRDLYDTLFIPSLPGKKKALERTFLAEPDPHAGTSADPPPPELPFRHDIGLYKKITVVLREDVFNAANVPNTEFIFAARDDIRCGQWQSLDTGSKEFFPESRAFVCTITTDKYEETVCESFTKSVCDAFPPVPCCSKPLGACCTAECTTGPCINNDIANMLIQDTLFKVIDPSNSIGDCERKATPGPFELYPETNAANNVPPCTCLGGSTTCSEDSTCPDGSTCTCSKCEFHIFDEPEPEPDPTDTNETRSSKYWGRGWSTFTQRVDQNYSRGDDYACFRANLDRTNVNSTTCAFINNPHNDSCVDADPYSTTSPGNPILLFAGDSYCRRHIGFQHGAYQSGIQIANTIIKAVEPDWADWYSNYKTQEFCDESPPTGGPGNYRQSKAVP